MGRRRQFLGGGAASAPPCKVHTVSYIFMEREDYLTGRGVYKYRCRQGPAPAQGYVCQFGGGSVQVRTVE